MTEIDDKTEWNPLKSMIFILKLLILINFVKKNSTSGGPKIRLTANMPPAADSTASGLNGAENLRKISKIIKKL